MLEITNSLFKILRRNKETSSPHEQTDWTNLLELSPEGKVKVLCLKILSNAVLGANSTSPLFYSFLQLFEKIIDLDAENAEEDSTP